MNRAERRSAEKRERRSRIFGMPREYAEKAARVTALLVEPMHDGAAEIVTTAFGTAGGEFLERVRSLMDDDPDRLVVMVGRPGRAPARVVIARGSHPEAAIDAALDMARELGKSSLWMLLVRSDRLPRLQELLALRGETVGPMQ